MHRFNTQRFDALAASLAALMLSIAPALAQGKEQQDDPGQVAFNTHCRNCHSTKEGDNRLGPSLHAIYGAKAGQVAGFGGYSGSLTPDIVWDEATLDKFITNPDSLASSTTMKPFPGIADAAERKKIIEFLKSSTAS
jgi:cytochrome c